MTARPEKFGRYELLERLATGGMAELYRAVLSGPYEFRKTVAIKKILPHLNGDPLFRKLFLHEGRIMSGLNHRNLVQVFELGEAEGELFICLEYVEGHDLATVLRICLKKNLHLDPVLCAWIARELCWGLEYVHRFSDSSGQPLGIIHRDVNPRNILISREGDVKLGDFGIAKSTVQEDKTRQGQVRGKMDFLSPEQARGAQASPLSDLFMVGLVLFEMLTLQRYIQGNGDLELMQRAARPVWRSVRKINPEVPDWLEEIVHRSLSIEPELRYPSASAFADELSRFIQNAPCPPDNHELSRFVLDLTEEPLLADDPDHVVTASPSIESAAPPVVPGALPGGSTRTAPQIRRVVEPQRQPGKGHSRHSILGWSAALGLVVVAITWGLIGTRSQTPGAAQRQSLSTPVSTQMPTSALAIAPAIQPTPTQPSNIELPHERPSPRQLSPSSAVNEKPRKTRNSPTRQAASEGRERNPSTRPSGNAVATRGAGAEAIGEGLEQQRARLRKLGIRPGDVPAVDQKLDLLRGLLRDGDVPSAQAALASLQGQIEATRVDQPFIERKMKRLEQRLQRGAVEERYAQPVREILKLIIQSRFEEANAAINRILDQL